MVWDTEETKRKLKAAATAEFAERGPDGTTMERIARRAGVNKERLYNYFGDKTALFTLVLGDELNRLAAAVPLTQITSPADVGTYAAAVFDYHQEHPELTRLLIWEGLAALPEVPDEEARTAYYAQKVAAFRAAQQAGTIAATTTPESMTFLVIALAGWWHAVPQMARMIHAGAPADADPRDSVEAAATALATPGAS